LLAKLECRDRVKEVAFSPEGKLLAPAFGWNSQDGVRVWNVADRKVLAILSTGNNDGANVECIAFSPDGKLLAAANWNGDVLVWTTGSWKSPPSILTCYSNVA
jgi:WD40 repeat protein